MSNQSQSEKGAAPSLRELTGLRTLPAPLPGWQPMYRQMARMSGLADSGAEVLDAGWGGGATLRLLVDEFRVRSTGVGRDPKRAESVRADLVLDGYAARAQYQDAPLEALPYKDGVFDLAIGGEQVAVSPDPAQVVRELGRVVRAGGSVVLLQWVWRSPLSHGDRQLVADHLGVSPRPLGEWRTMLDQAGIEVDMSEYWAEGLPGLEDGRVPAPTLADLVPFRERLVLLKRALLRWGADSVRGLLARDRAVRGILARQAVVGLCMVRGIRRDSVETSDSVAAAEDAMNLFGAPDVTGEPKAPPPLVAVQAPARQAAPTPQHVEVENLPLFTVDSTAP